MISYSFINAFQLIYAIISEISEKEKVAILAEMTLKIVKVVNNFAT